MHEQLFYYFPETLSLAPECSVNSVELENGI